MDCTAREIYTNMNSFGTSEKDNSSIPWAILLGKGVDSAMATGWLFFTPWEILKVERESLTRVLWKESGTKDDEEEWEESEDHIVQLLERDLMGINYCLHCREADTSGICFWFLLKWSSLCAGLAGVVSLLSWMCCWRELMISLSVLVFKKD